MSRQVSLLCSFALVATFVTVPLLPARAHSSRSLTAAQRHLVQKQEALEVRLANARLTKTETHPDVVALKSQLQANDRLLPHSRTTKATLLAYKRAYLRTKQEALEVRFADARRTKTDSSPDVVALKKQIKALEHSQ